MTAEQKADKLREAVALLMDADACMQAALGPTDECYEMHNKIEETIDELNDKIGELV